MTGWVYLEHPDTGGTTRVPDHPDVLTVHEARGWVRVDPPEEEPAVPAGPPPGDAAWVDLVHPELPTGVHRVPNNPVALQGAYDAGWRSPEPRPEEQSQDEPVDKPTKRKPKASSEPADHDKEG